MSLRPPLQHPLRSALRSPLTPRVTGAAGAPTPIAGMAVWLRKGTASGASWPDASGNARNGTLVASPTVGASSVTFNGSTQYMTVSPTGVSSTFSVYLRVKQIAWTLNARIVSGAPARLHQAASSANLAYFDSDLQNYGENSAGALGVFQRVGLVVNPAVGCVISINGTETFDPGATAADVLGSLSVAASSTGVNPANIELEELILYPVALNPAQRAQMDAYLAAL